MVLMLPPSPGGASLVLVLLRSQAKSRAYRALARASLRACGVSHVQQSARRGYGSLLPPGYLASMALSRGRDLEVWP